jgi:AraC-like DNA-binding protein
MRYRVYSTGELSLLNVHAIGYSFDVAGSTFASRKNEFHLVGYVLSGKGIYNGHPLSAGQGFIFTPNVVENIYPDKTAPLELLWFTSADARFYSILKYYEADEDTHIFTHAFPHELQYIKEFVLAENRSTVSDGKMLELFFSVFKYHQNKQGEPSEHRSAHQKYIDFSVSYIKANYSHNITVSKLTKILGISQPYLYKIYKQAFGKSPKEFIDEYRITRAKEMLADTDLTVAKIASGVGFSDSFAFSKCFSSKQGCSPSEYRRMHKTNNE